jgi:hypothetical protein
MPAPPEESEPAMVSTTAGDAINKNPLIKRQTEGVSKLSYAGINQIRFNGSLSACSATRRQAPPL